MKKKFIKSSIAIALAIGLVSCSTLNLPNFTSVEEIYTLQTGMSLAQVNQALGVTPHEFYTNFQDGSKVVEYKYRRQYQQVSSSRLPYVLNEGRESYRDEESVFVVFDSKSGKMLNYITSSGLKSATVELNNGNNLKLVKESPDRFKNILK